jgi:primosomal protein N' (replication factor Y)
MPITYRLLVIQKTQKEYFDYISNENLEIGRIVKVSFGKKIALACIMEKPNQNSYEGEKKTINFITNIILTSEILTFIKIFSKYHLCKQQEVLAYVLQKMPLKYKVYTPTLQKTDKGLYLTDEQNNVYNNISKNYNIYKISLIFGITGSGKTAIYFKLIEDIINSGGQVLLLVPEIGIISGIRERMLQQIHINPLLWFSGVKTANIWQKIVNGDNMVVLAARSGIFLPFKNLKLIIVDEEHDSSYKQSNHVSYHGRNMAILLGKIWNIPVVLGSATPSTETYYRAINHQYDMYRLTKRFGIAILPKVHFIQESKNIINDYCLREITRVLEKGEQVLIYLNKRGFAGILECIHCNVKQKCQQCDQVLVMHNMKKYMMCHLCNKKYLINVCITCGSTGLLVHGYGVERLEGFFKNKFPSYNIGVFSSDFCDSPTKIKEFIHKAKDGTYQIIIGTQITAKGHNFPALSLVVIINTQLQSGDFRGKESLLQNLLQVSGRAGRHNKESAVLIQSNDIHLQEWLREEKYEGFLKKSIEERRIWQLPPYCKLVMVKYQHKNLSKLKSIMEEIFVQIKEIKKKLQLELEIFPPSNNPIQKIRNEYRMFVLLKSNREFFEYLNEVVNKYPKCHMDVNPYEFY